MSNAKERCLTECKGIYAVVRHDTSNQTLSLNEDIDDEEFKAFVNEYIQYKVTHEANFEHFFTNISKSPKLPFLDQQAVQVPDAGTGSFRYERRLEMVKLYFTTPTFDLITRDARTNFVTKLSLIGGMLGLFTGFSFVSGMEVAYYALKFLLRICHE